MKQKILQSIRAHRASWRSTPKPANDLGDAHAAAIRSADDLPSFGAMFTAPPHRDDPSASPAQRDAEIRALAGSVERRQPGYQPVYGFEDEFPCKRIAHLMRNVEFATAHLQDRRRPQQVRILDIGSNNGWVALKLAETFPNVVGLEIAPEQLRLSRLLAARSGSSARFFGEDALRILAAGADDLENVDVVLLYNVVHQIIFLHGLEYTKAMLARLASRVDTLIVELARRSDYVRQGKSELLPENPEDVLADCADCRVTLLHDQPRPVYRLQRRVVRVGPVEIRPQRIEFSFNADPKVSRKYYTSADGFLKIYRYTDGSERAIFRREVAALLELRHTAIAPRLLDWVALPHCAAILMSRVPGERMTRVIHDPELAPKRLDERLWLTVQYLEIARTVHDAIGFQNDLQLHNLMARPDGTLALVDYEQASETASNDPFGLLLWTIFSIWGGRDPGKPQAVRSLRIREGDDRQPKAPIYPDFGGLKLQPTVAAMVEQAGRGGDWAAFLATWAPKVRAVYERRLRDTA